MLLTILLAGLLCATPINGKGSRITIFNDSPNYARVTPEFGSRFSERSDAVFLQPGASTVFWGNNLITLKASLWRQCADNLSNRKRSLLVHPQALPSMTWYAFDGGVVVDPLHTHTHTHTHSSGLHTREVLPWQLYQKRFQPFQ